MIKKCIPCIGAVIKQSIAERNKDMISTLGQIQDCEDPFVLDLCGGRQEKSKRGEKTKRAPSEYNLFIGSCMKGKKITGFNQAPDAMRECAIQWKKEKGKA